MLSYYERDGARIVPLIGEFNLPTSKQLEAFIVAAAAGSQPIVIDLSETTYMDSTVLTTLVRQKKSLGPQLRIVVPKAAKLRRIFEITILHVALDVEESITSACTVSSDTIVTD